VIVEAGFSFPVEGIQPVPVCAWGEEILDCPQAAESAGDGINLLFNRGIIAFIAQVNTVQAGEGGGVGRFFQKAKDTGYRADHFTSRGGGAEVLHIVDAFTTQRIHQLGTTAVDRQQDGAGPVSVIGQPRLDRANHPITCHALIERITQSRSSSGFIFSPRMSRVAGLSGGLPWGSPTGAGSINGRSRGRRARKSGLGCSRVQFASRMMPGALRPLFGSSRGLTPRSLMKFRRKSGLAVVKVS